MFQVDSADMCAGKYPLVSMGGRAEGLACADPGARTPIGAIGNFLMLPNYGVIALHGCIQVWLVVMGGRETRWNCVIK